VRDSTPGEARDAATLSVVIPAYNEEATIAGILDRVHAVEGISKEIIVVDDCSSDRTRELIEGELRERIGQVICHEKNQGKGAALRTGIRHATGRFVIIQDADLEYDPEDYHTVLEPLLSGRADVCYGSRYLPASGRRVYPYWHTQVNKFLTWLSNMFTNLNLTDMETCYKCFRREVIQSVDIVENRFGFEPEVTAKISRMPGLRICEVAVSYEARTYEAGKKIGWKDGVRALWCIFKYNVLRRS
jgi:glycosyltransferase involved in cell wall biosynthesis